MRLSYTCNGNSFIGKMAFYIKTIVQQLKQGLHTIYIYIVPKYENLVNEKVILYIFIPPPNEVGGGVYWIHLVRPSVCPSVRPSVCRRHGFRSISQVCFGISISNFICMLMVAIGRSLLIFSDVTFKMTAWRPYCFFGFRTLTLLWLWISTSNFSGTILMYMGRSLLIFSNVIFKMATWRPC